MSLLWTILPCWIRLHALDKQSLCRWDRTRLARAGGGALNRSAHKRTPHGFFGHSVRINCIIGREKIEKNQNLDWNGPLRNQTAAALTIISISLLPPPSLSLSLFLSHTHTPTHVFNRLNHGAYDISKKFV